MNTKLYKKLQESLEDVFQPPTEDELFIAHIKEQGAYQNSDGTWSCDGDMSIAYSELKIPIQFKEVKGSFLCGFGRLTTLEGCPEKVGGKFVCSVNKITSLKGGPKYVGKDFLCFDNKLTSLEGSPEIVKGDFDCSMNQLTTLKGCPEKIEGNRFSCSLNRLASLEGGPKYVNGNFHCSHNQLTSLKGISKVEGHIYCKFNPVPEKELLATIGR